MSGRLMMLIEDLESLKMVLGELSLKILETLQVGPLDVGMINLLTGLPVACIEGRIPVLRDLQMIVEKDNQFLLRQAGTVFLKHVREIKNKA